MIGLLFDPSHLFFGKGVVVISVLVNLRKKRVQKVNVTCSVVIQRISFARWLVAKKEFRVDQIYNMTLSFVWVLLQRHIINLDKIESFERIMMVDGTFKYISATTKFL